MNPARVQEAKRLRSEGLRIVEIAQRLSAPYSSVYGWIHAGRVRLADIPARYPVGRRCIDCGTPLNSYNPGPECLLHRPPERFHDEQHVDLFAELMSEAA